MAATQDVIAGYESIEDLGDVEVEREPIPARTDVELHMAAFDLDIEEKGKEHFIARFEVLAPEDHEGHVFFQRMYLGNTPKEGKKATATAWYMTLRTLKALVAGILQLPENNEGVRLFFSGIEVDPENLGATLFMGIRDKMRTLINQPFATRIGVEQDKKKEYDPKQTIGKVRIPKEDKEDVAVGEAISA